MAKKTDKIKYDHPGQPTKYRPEFCEGIIKYFNVKPWELLNGKRVYKQMPSLIRYAQSINVAIATVYNWVDKEHASFQPEFLDAYNRALAIRKEWLIDVGLSGVAPANSFKFVAVNCTNMRDKIETDHGVTDGMADLLKEIGANGAGLSIKNPQE